MSKEKPKAYPAEFREASVKLVLNAGLNSNSCYDEPLTGQIKPLALKIVASFEA